jgi:peptidoglycan/xylan/chitin deacetylase (PgdA/CDA1 family)
MALMLCATGVAGCSRSAAIDHPRLAAGHGGPARDARVPPPRRRLVARTILRGSTRRRWVALTFDADMTEGMLRALRDGRQRSWYDGRIVAELRKTGTPATIFLTGLWARTYPGVVRRLARDPLFELENHSFDHAAWRSPCYLLPTVHGGRAKMREVAATAAIIQRLTGRRPRYFRYPGGCHDGTADDRLVNRVGEQPVDWNVVSQDAFDPDPGRIEQAVAAGARPGSIVVMHIMGAPNAPATAQALPAIIAGLRARGLRPVTVARLLAGR